MVRCANQYGDVVRLHLGKPTLLLTNPDDIRHVLVTHSTRYAKTLRISGSAGQRWLGKSILTSLGEPHRRLRRTLQPLFVPKAVEAFQDVIIESVQQWISCRQEGERIDIAEHMRDLSQRIMMQALFGSSEDMDAVLFQAIRTRRLYHEHIVGSMLPMPQYQPTRIRFRYISAARRIDAVLDRRLFSRHGSDPSSNDMISRWMRTVSDDGTPMSDEQIRAEALNFIDTGYETIGAALAWTWYLLAEHPSVEEQLSAELSRIVGGSPLLAEHVVKLPFATAVLKESLRLYPPTWSYARTALKPDVLPSGVEVAEGMKLFLCQYIVHRSPRFFSEPDAFQPERFLAASEPTSQRFSYFPFGGGAHQCLGESFAELECILVLSALATRFRFRLEPNQAVRPNSRFALRPASGVRVIVLKK
jgi:cytochrome P450